MSGLVEPPAQGVVTLNEDSPRYTFTTDVPDSTNVVQGSTPVPGPSVPSDSGGLETLRVSTPTEYLVVFRPALPSTLGDDPEMTKYRPGQQVSGL